MTDSVICIRWQADWVGCGWGHSCPNHVHTLRTTGTLRQKRQSCHLIPTTNGFAGHPCGQHRHAAGLQIMRASPRLARRSRYDSAKRLASPSTRSDHLKVQARPIESVASNIWSSKRTFRGPFWGTFADPFSATISIGNLPLQRPRLEVSYHRKRCGRPLWVGLSAQRKPRWVFPLTGIHP